MQSSIRPNRTELSRNFPVLGFTIRTSRSPAWFDVALATDPRLFTASVADERNADNWYSTHDTGPMAAPKGESVWIAPAAAVNALSSSPLIYFALATFTSSGRDGAEIWIPAPERAPSVGVSESYRRVRRPALVAAGGGAGYPSTATRHWAGDTATPGIEHVSSAPEAPTQNGAQTPTNGTTNGDSMHPNNSNNGHVAVQPQAFEYDDGLGLDFWSSPQAKMLSGQSFDVRHEDVLHIAQPTGMSCWAAAAAMVVSWRDRQSGVTPEDIARGAGQWAAYQSGLNPDHHDELAAAWGLTVEPPQSYTVEGLRNLVEYEGPLWIGVAVPSGHAVVITGIWGDGTPEGTTIRYNDPWPVGTGVEGATKVFTDFMREYENRITTDSSGTVNVQILHAAGRSGPQAGAQAVPMASHGNGNVGPDDVGIEGPPPADLESTSAVEAMAIQAAVRRVVPMQAQTPDYPQASRFEPAGAGHFTPRQSRTIDRIVIHITDGGPNINGTIRWFQLPQDHEHFKPVSSHYIVGQDGEVVQMVRHNDIAHHARGANTNSIGIEHVANTRGLDYTESQYCNSAALVRWIADQHGIPVDRAHILGHREATQTTKSCPGQFDWDYFMSMVVRQQCFARADMPTDDVGRYVTPGATAQALAHDSHLARSAAAPAVVPIVSSIVGASMNRVASNQGDVSWELDQLNGLKHVGNDPANQGSGAWRDGPVINVGHFTTGGLVDDITATFEVRWQYNGRSLGNVGIGVLTSNDAVGWGLRVTAEIHDDAQTYTRPNIPTFAGIRLRFTYRFDRMIGSDKIGIRDLHLYGDGTWRETSRWTQR